MEPPGFINEDSLSAHYPRQGSAASPGMPGQSQGPAGQQQSPAEAAATAGHEAWPASPMRAASGWLATPKSMKAPLTPPSRMLPGVAAAMPFQPMQPVFFGPVVFAPLPLHGHEWVQPGLAGPAPAAAAPSDVGGQGAAALTPRFERLPLHSQVRSLSGPGSLAQPPLGPAASEQQRRARAVDNVRQLLQRSGGAYPPGQGGLTAPPVPPQSPPLGSPAAGALGPRGGLLAQGSGAAHPLQAPQAPMAAAAGLGAQQPLMVRTKPGREGQGAFGSPVSLLSKAPTSPTTMGSASAAAAGALIEQQQQQQVVVVKQEQQVEQQAEQQAESAGREAGESEQFMAAAGRQRRHGKAAAGGEQLGAVGGEGPGRAASGKPAGTKVKAASAKGPEQPATQQQQLTGPARQRPAHKAGPRPVRAASAAAAAQQQQQRARSPQPAESAQPAMELQVTSPAPMPRGRSRRRQTSRKRQRRRSPTPSSQEPLLPLPPAQPAAPPAAQPAAQPAADASAEASGSMAAGPAGPEIKAEAVEVKAGPAGEAAKTEVAAAVDPDPPAAAGPAAPAGGGPGEAGAAAAGAVGADGMALPAGAGAAGREGHHDPEGLGLLEAACWVERQDSDSNAVAPIWSSAGSRARAGPGPFKATFGAALLGSPLGMLMSAAPSPQQQQQQRPAAGASSGGRDSELVQVPPEAGEGGEGGGASKGYSMRSERYKGVYRMPTGRWRAQFTHKSRVVQLGMFNNDEQAARAWDKAAIQYRGASTKTNLPVDRATAEAWAAEPIPGPKNGEEPPPRKRPSQGAQLKHQKQKQHGQKQQAPRQQKQKKRQRAASPSVHSETTLSLPKRQRAASPSVHSAAAPPKPKRQRSASTAGGGGSRTSIRSADSADVSNGPSRQRSLSASLPKAAAAAGRLGTGSGGSRGVSGRPPRPPSAAGERKERQQGPAPTAGAGSAEGAAPKGRPPSRSRKKASKQAATGSETAAPPQPPTAAAAPAAAAAGAGGAAERQQSSYKSGASQAAETPAGKRSASRSRKRKVGGKPAAELERQGSQGTAGTGDEGAAA